MLYRNLSPVLQGIKSLIPSDPGRVRQRWYKHSVYQAISMGSLQDLRWVFIVQGFFGLVCRFQQFITMTLTHTHSCIPLGQGTEEYIIYD